MVRSLKSTREAHKAMKLETILATGLISAFLIYFIITDVLTFKQRLHCNVHFIGEISLDCIPIIHTSYTVLQICTFLSILKLNFKYLNQKVNKLATACFKNRKTS